MPRSRQVREAKDGARKMRQEHAPSLKATGDPFVKEVNDLVANMWRTFGHAAQRAATHLRGLRAEQKIAAAKGKRNKLTAELMKAVVGAASGAQKERIAQLHNESEPLDEYSEECQEKDKEIKKAFLEIIAKIENVDGISVVKEYLVSSVEERGKDDLDEEEEQ
ncbi:uncharacterized protein FOMMEDRAFT_150414 [Fomitiporia mediterranea MF3/22]|uniref:uncharacterized protein n=1 Tax=Fomitiporia mediterranea (strain MF3/22) TaxID=694068 RepID=UPI0004409A6E|nr:uncharacterized protein FOMMEDRAFT_150414 [Fomitiporia mediterranea MF3/22]EJD07833.1 hypothetical protein FOMMEDRAFT_150414 [Fomitiporia mediterranea MF3/22]